jgi:hypothetical protein
MIKQMRLFLAYLLTGAIFFPSAAKVFHEFVCEHVHTHSVDSRFENPIPSCDYLLFHFSHADTHVETEFVFITPKVDSNEGFTANTLKSDTFRYSFRLRAPPSSV